MFSNIKKYAIIYHKDCLDGFAAAYLLVKAIEKVTGEYYLYPMHYGDAVPDITDSSVLIVDFSLPMDILVDLAGKNYGVYLTDHHASAFKMLAEEYSDVEDIPTDATFEYSDGNINLDIYLDNNRSGCGIIRDFVKDMVFGEYCYITDLLNAHSRLLKVINAIEDRDLWRFLLPDTEVYAAIMSDVSKTVESWDRIFYELTDTEFDKIFSRAKTIKEVHNTMAGEAASKATLIDFQGMKIPVLNCTSLISLTNDKMDKDTGISMTYFISSDPVVIVSLRSRGDINVGKMAEKYGGGGHKNAAGFKLPVNLLSDLLTGKL